MEGILLRSRAWASHSSESQQHFSETGQISARFEAVSRSGKRDSWGPECIPFQKRQVPHQRFGLNAISKILAVHAPSNWVAYNQPVEKTLRRFGYIPPRDASAAGKFAAFTRMMDAFKSATGLQDAYALDAFFYHLFREPKAG